MKRNSCLVGLIVVTFFVISFFTNLEGASGDLNAFLVILHGFVLDGLASISVHWLFTVMLILMIGLIAAFPFPSVAWKEDELVRAFSTHVERLLRGAERGVANRISEFLNVYNGFEPQTTGAQAVSRFWGRMTGGTVLGLGLLRVFRSRHLVVAFSVGAIGCRTAALATPGYVAQYAFSTIAFWADSIVENKTMGLGARTTRPGKRPRTRRTSRSTVMSPARDGGSESESSF